MINAKNKSSLVIAQQKLAARELAEKDFLPYKKLFLRALQEEGQLFGPTYEDRIKMSDEEWQQRFNPTPDHRYFGLFDREKIVGVLFASRWEEDKSGKTALWGSAYIIPEYRGQGLGEPLYKAREEWTSKHPRFKRAVFFILEGNKRSTEIHEKQGATHVSTETMTWPHRPPALWRWYEKSISKDNSSAKPHQPCPSSHANLLTSRVA